MNRTKRENAIGAATASGLAIALTTLLAGCPSPTDQPDPPVDGVVLFSTHIQPIFNASCRVCHRPGGIALLRGIEVQLLEGVSYDFLVDRPSVQDPELTLVVPGDSSASLLYLKVSASAPPVGSRMPLNRSALTQTQINLIRDWIDQGALDN